MRRLWLVSILVLCIFILLTGCSKTNKQIIDEYIYTIPTLTVEFDNNEVDAITGTYSWYILLGVDSKGVENDVVSPEEQAEYQDKPITVYKDTEIHLNFSKEPINYSVKIWNSEDYDLSYIIDCNDKSIMVGKNQPRTIYEVIADYKYMSEDIEEEGTIFYTFVVNSEEKNAYNNIQIWGNGEMSHELEEKSNVIVIVSNQSNDISNVAIDGDINGVQIFNDYYFFEDEHKLYYYYISANPGEYNFNINTENASLNQEFKILKSKPLWIMFSYWNDETESEKITVFSQNEEILID